MVSDYTPTTDEVRGDYANFQLPASGGDFRVEYAEGLAEFDRWLAAHDAEVRASALAEQGEPGRKVDDALVRRIVAAVVDAGVSRAVVDFEWPKCHKAKCQGRHGSPDAAMGHMKHVIIDAVKLELQYETTTRPDFGDGEPHEVAMLTLATLLRRYNVREASTFANAASLMLDAYPSLVPVLAGLPVEENGESDADV